MQENILRRTGAVIAGALVFWAAPLVMLTAQPDVGVWQGAWVRGLLAGATVALALREGPRWWIVATLAGAASILGAVLLGIETPLEYLLAAACAAIAAFAGAFAVNRGARRALALGVLLLIFGTYLWSIGLVGGPNAEPVEAFKMQTVSPEPVTEQYAFDGFIYLKAFHLVAQFSSFLSE